ELLGVVALSASDVWAVGLQSASSLTEHWDGTAWAAVSSPNQVGADYLVAVSATSDSDIWAVGYYNPSNAYQTLGMHFSYAGVGCPTATPTFTTTPTRTATATPVCPPGTRTVYMVNLQFMPQDLTI